MFELEHKQFNTIFEFNRSLEGSINEWEFDELWSNINKCKNQYLKTKDRNLLFLIDFFVSQLIGLSGEQDQSGEIRLQFTELFNDLFRSSCDLPKNQWLLIVLMKQFDLAVEKRVEKKVDLLITLNESATRYETNKLLKFIERNPKDLDEEKLLIKLQRILKENPHLGTYTPID